MFPSLLYAQENVISGGRLNAAWNNNTGQRDSGSFMNGHIWNVAQTDAHIMDADFTQMHWGFSFEQANQGQLLLNQAYLKHGDHDSYITIGRSLNASSLLFHDLSDFGAVGVGIDNHPNSFFVGGNFPSNVAQQVAQPFANRLSYFHKIGNWAGLGLSYTPFIDKDHTAGYTYYTQTNILHETSIAASFQASWRQFFIGFTAGGTHARYKNDINFFGGDVYSEQFSFYVRHDLSNTKYNLYEMNYGCLSADHLERDCRMGWQISRFRGDWIHTTAIKKRFDIHQIYSDYAKGVAYQFSDSVTIGVESLARILQNQDLTDGDLHWNFGISIKI